MTASSGSTSNLELVNVSKTYAQRSVVTNVSLKVASGNTVCIIGPSGAGKSTLLRCINHLEAPSGGYVLLGDEIIGYQHRRGALHPLGPRGLAKQRKRIGMVFQHFNLYSHMTALENIVEAPIRVLGVSRSTARDRAYDLLDAVGLKSRAAAYSAQLSGGEQQRIAIARSLALKPDLILFDEPTSALDPETVGEVLEIMKRVSATGMTMVVVTHEIGFARAVADHVVFMDDGRVVESGPPDSVLTNPQHDRTRSFLERVL